MWCVSIQVWSGPLDIRDSMAVVLFNRGKADAPITYFQDDCRNALCGPPDNPRDKHTDRGYAGGKITLGSGNSTFHNMPARAGG